MEEIKEKIRMGREIERRRNLVNHIADYYLRGGDLSPSELITCAYYVLKRDSNGELDDKALMYLALTSLFEAESIKEEVDTWIKVANERK